MTVEQAVGNALSGKALTYSIENLKLTLISEDGVKMVFKKAD
jgi:heat shock protein HslJ